MLALHPKTLKRRGNPRTAFAGHTRETPWDDLDQLYFSGYVMWTYRDHSVSSYFTSQFGRVLVSISVTGPCNGRVDRTRTGAVPKTPTRRIEMTKTDSPAVALALAHAEAWSHHDWGTA